MTVIDSEVIMIGNKCFKSKVEKTNIRYVRRWLFWKKQVCNFSLSLIQCPAKSITQKINCEC